MKNKKASWILKPAKLVGGEQIPQHFYASSVGIEWDRD